MESPSKSCPRCGADLSDAASPGGLCPKCLMELGRESKAAEPESVDLRPAFGHWGLPSRAQGVRPTCSVFVVTGAMEYALADKQRHGTRLSVEFLNWASNRAIRKRADGGVFLVRNSSKGPRNGAMSYEYVRAYMNDALWIDYDGASSSRRTHGTAEN